ncbi:hypothetical protein [Paracidobacterium acidisoli]|uniref:hypothetical protein n=1 Tax=Paracidobacterium acidisoli TaxID=2303751 RepID=UPI0011C141A0|nr:hypothetical protein [Paracidobacterium acidisoli]MBT9331487.1 hypothetical protein [Paracidobacterium acidisoli]
MPNEERILRRLLRYWQSRAQADPEDMLAYQAAMRTKESLELLQREPELWKLQQWPPPPSKRAAIIAALQREHQRKQHNSAGRSTPASTQRRAHQ